MQKVERVGDIKVGQIVEGKVKAIDTKTEGEKGNKTRVIIQLKENEKITGILEDI